MGIIRIRRRADNGHVPPSKAQRGAQDGAQISCIRDMMQHDVIAAAQRRRVLFENSRGKAIIFARNPRQRFIGDFDADMALLRQVQQLFASLASLRPGGKQQPTHPFGALFQGLHGGEYAGGIGIIQRSFIGFQGGHRRFLAYFIIFFISASFFGVKGA